MTCSTRIDLRVPFAEKDQAKARGAQWDGRNRIWYAPAGTDLRPLRRWLPDGLGEQPAVESSAAPPPRQPEKGISLGELLRRVQGTIQDGFPEAEWVRAEISELRGKNGHLYLSLSERNERGDPLAQARAVIWRDRAAAITAKFAAATGEGLKPDIKILCLAQVRFDPLYGFDLTIQDVDPSFTLGDLAANLDRIRATLQQAGLYARNKRFAAPVEFVRVAVISPETSAGLGDFRQETDRLHLAGLCEFHFFQATFQGVEAPSSIQAALLQALTASQHRPFDALVIIRGGGAVTDLAWLNDLDLAKLVCQSPIPVLTGIGHERDNTVLDEIAHTRFDTPSKVALHIRNTIKDNALAAIEHRERINALVGRILDRERTLLATHADRLQTGAFSLLRRVASEQEGLIRLTHAATSAAIREATVALEAERAKITDVAGYALREAQLGVSRLVESLAQRVQMQWAGASKDIDHLARIVVGMGPGSTLERGFAIVRADDDQPLTSRQAAMVHASFQIQFHDGRLGVKVKSLDRSDGDQQ
jgi:exodeoxyribonuclease VII large subunit